MHNKRNKGTARDRIIWYVVHLKESIQGIKRHGSLHLFGNGFAWYVYPYRRLEDAKGKDDPNSRRIRMFWDFMDGNKRFYPYFYSIYLRAIRQLLWMKKTIGPVELVPVPRSDPEADDPVRDICRMIVKEETFILSNLKDGADLVKRTRKMFPVHKGAKYTVSEIENSMEVTRPLNAPVVILVDDMVFSGKTIAACRRLLKEAGAGRVYALCLYGYKRK